MNGHQASLFALVGTLVLVAGILVDALSSALGMIALITGLSTGAAREAAVLAGWPEAAVRRATAVGFFAGFVVSLGVFAVDGVIGAVDLAS